MASFRHWRINHHDGSVEKVHNHINGIENFWNQAKRQLRRYNGIPKHHRPLFIKEAESRFNHGLPGVQLRTRRRWVKLATRSSIRDSPLWIESDRRRATLGQLRGARAATGRVFNALGHCFEPLRLVALSMGRPLRVSISGALARASACTASRREDEHANQRRMADRQLVGASSLLAFDLVDQDGSRC